jgi:uncharacterized membrane protein YfcA
MLAGGVATVPLGVWLLQHVDGTCYAVGLGIFLTLYGAYRVLQRESPVVRGSLWLDLGVGALGGITGGLAGFPGAFVTIWCSMRGWDKLLQRAVYQPYLLVMQVVTVVWLRFQAPPDASLAQDAVYVPMALLGAIGGLALYRNLSNRQFQVVISVLLGVSGVGLIARGL